MRSVEEDPVSEVPLAGKMRTYNLLRAELHALPGQHQETRDRRSPNGPAIG